MREVNVEVECIALMPVRVKASLLIKADSDASIPKAVKAWANNEKYTKADIEDVDLDEILTVGMDEEDYDNGKYLDLDNLVENQLIYPSKLHPIKIVKNSIKVIDSR